jgi:hypothetical protein
MAGETLSAVQYALARNEKKIQDIISDATDQPLRGLLRSLPKERASGRALRTYFNQEYMPMGGSGVVSEGGNFGAARTSGQTQLYIDPKLYYLTIQFSVHALAALKGKLAADTLSRKINSSVYWKKQRIMRDFCGDGSGVVARANAVNTTTSSATFTSSIPVLAVPGDFVYSLDATTSGEERALTSIDGTSGAIGSTGVRVIDVDPDAKKLFLGAVAKWKDNVVLSKTLTAATYPIGLMSHLNDYGAKSKLAWDADDLSSTMRCPTSYMSGSRVTNNKLNCRSYDCSSATVSLKLLQRGVAKCRSRGVNPSDLIFLMSPVQFELIIESLEGGIPRDVEVKLPGGNYKLPGLTGTGVAQIPVICDYGMPDSFICVGNKKGFKQITIPTGWWNGKPLNGKPGTTAGTDASAYVGHWQFFYGTALPEPDEWTILYRLATS